MNDISKIGGARIGFLNATFPFASLRVDVDGIFLNVTLIGKYRFSFDSIIKIEKVGFIPFIGWGIRIFHSIEEYPSKIIFWCFGNPNKLKTQIESFANIKSENQKTLFEKMEDVQTIEKLKVKSKFPIKIHYIVLVVLIWNVLFWLDYSNSTLNSLGPFSLIAVIMVLLLALLIKFSDKVKKEILTDINSYNKVGGFINLLIVVTGFMSIIMLIFLVSA